MAEFLGTANRLRFDPTATRFVPSVAAREGRGICSGRVCHLICKFLQIMVLSRLK
jgi:hypothetical protein